DPEEIFRLVATRLKELCPPTVSMEITPMHGGKPALTPTDHPAVQAAATAMEKAFHKRPAFIRSGGTVPVVASMVELLGVPVVLMGIGLPDEHSHAPNERLDLGNFFGGIRAAAFLWDEMARQG
ncbi:MAG: M20/M25/M40 family metallo-hydrolase, partial [Actinobacteria bacterium]|nr:M20/M25/M40 family metallo-hydrolase [Actinomycetota bacterium]